MVALSCGAGLGGVGQSRSLHTCEMDMEHFGNSNLSVAVAVAKYCFRVSGTKPNFFVFSLYFNPDLDDGIYDCLLTSMAAGQIDGDLNHQKWLDSMTTNHHGVIASTSRLSGCDQLAVGPTHAHGGILDLLMTDVPDVVRVSVVAPISN